MRLPAEAPLPPGSLLFKVLETRRILLGMVEIRDRRLKRSQKGLKERGHVKPKALRPRMPVRWLEPNVEIACEVRLFQPGAQFRSYDGVEWRLKRSEATHGPHVDSLSRARIPMALSLMKNLGLGLAVLEPRSSYAESKSSATVRGDVKGGCHLLAF